MTYEHFLKTYNELLEVMVERGAADLKAINKYLEMIDFLNPTTTEKSELYNLFDEYKEAIVTEKSAFQDFTKIMGTVNDALIKEDEMKNKIKDLTDKIQSKSLEQIQEQIEK